MKCIFSYINILKVASFIFVYLLVNNTVKAQLLPPQQLLLNEAPGTPGRVPKSFIIAWQALPTDSLKDSVHYEYVVSDNPACCKKCPGDTRHGTTTSTEAVLHNFIIGKWYYWKVRGIYSNGDTTEFTEIFSFLTHSDSCDCESDK